MEDNMQLLENLLSQTNDRPKTVVIPCACDNHVLIAVEMARKNGLIKAILIDDKNKLLHLMSSLSIDPMSYEIIDESDVDFALSISMLVIQNGRADFLMKGLIDTKLILKKVLDKKYGFRKSNRMTHATLVESAFYHKPFLLSDAAMNIDQSLETKIEIIKNGVFLLHKLSINQAKVAVLSAVEKTNEKLESTLIAQQLKELSLNEDFYGAIIEGPLQLDNAINKESATHKQVDNLVAGDADFLVMPNLEAGNIFYKSLMFLSEAKSASVVLGASFPIVVTSRADSSVTKYHSILLASLLCEKKDN